MAVTLRGKENNFSREGRTLTHQSSAGCILLAFVSVLDFFWFPYPFTVLSVLVRERKRESQVWKHTNSLAMSRGTPKTDTWNLKQIPIVSSLVRVVVRQLICLWRMTLVFVVQRGKG